MKNQSIIDFAPSESTARTWNGRDDINQHYFGAIPEDQRTVTLTLNWKASANGTLRQVGRYRINLARLEAEGYVRKSKRGYILRFQRTGEIIEVAINRASKALFVGRWP